MVHVAAITEPMIISIYSSYRAQIVLWKSKEVKMSTKYFDFYNVFFLDS